MSIVLIIMMLVAVFTESPEQIENFLGGCITGNRDPNDPSGQNCTTLTLTKIKDVPPPLFQPPAFGGFDYMFCNEFSKDEDGQEIRLYDSKPRYPEGFKLGEYDFGNFTCKNGETEDVWFVSFGDMMSQLGAGIIIQPIVSFLQHIALAKSFSKKPPQYQVDTTQVQIRIKQPRIKITLFSGTICIWNCSNCELICFWNHSDHFSSVSCNCYVVCWEINVSNMVDCWFNLCCDSFPL